jgi:MFS family permease
VAVVVTLGSTRESRDPTAPRVVDVPGVVSLTLGLGSLVFALVESNSWGWGSARTLGLLALAALSLAAFAVIETRVRVPMVDFAFFRSRSFLGTNLVAFLVSFAMFATFFFITLYMQNVRGYSPIGAGVRFLPMTAIIMVVAPLSGRLADRIGPRPPMALGLLAVAGSLYWQGHLAPDTEYLYLLGAFCLMGLGLGLVMSPMSTAAMNAIDPRKAGVASGVLSMNRMIGSTFGVAAMGALVAGLGRARIDDLLPELSGERRQQLTDGLGAGALGDQPGRVHDAVQSAFLYSVNHGLRLAAIVAAAGALAAWVLVDRRQTAPERETAELREAAPELVP